MVSKSTILLCPARDTEESVDLGLPTDSDNIFQRLIRNPHLNSDTPRERECTEMLCSVLCNAPILRSQLLRWIGRFVGDLPHDFDDIEFQIDTEGSIGSKRDDLRIEGWRHTEEGQELVLIWTVEVKVGAQFHESSFQYEEADDSELVNQLINYDVWLDQQSAQYRGGFVLALSNMSGELPQSLRMPWYCFTWTGLGQEVQQILEQESPARNRRFVG